MTAAELETPVRTGQRKREAVVRAECDALIRSGLARLTDAQREERSPESRFDLAYNAAHALSLAALRLRGYRSEHRYIVFQVLPFTAGVPASVWRVLAKAHGSRNAAEYEGEAEFDERLIRDVIESATAVAGGRPGDARGLDHGECRLWRPDLDQVVLRDLDGTLLRALTDGAFVRRMV